MAHLSLVDLANRSMPMSEKPKKWVPKKDFENVGGEKGKLHRELGIPEGEKIPASKMKRGLHSRNPEVKRDAERAETMKGWRKPSADERRKKLYDKSK